mmetsp:Transcript_11948/g.14439  ORF Transcript_11948/g.14439 Transcript_11948/m.14439 type:complete len:305 (+) Transcript_11948:74-988(+)
MSIISKITILTTTAEKAAIAPALAQLAAPTEFSSYGEDQWNFLLQATNVDALVISNNHDNSTKQLLGSLLRIRYGRHRAYGMMLVSKEARGQGLAKKLLREATKEDLDADTMKILGACSELGRPLYEKMGFQRVSTVTRMTIPCCDDDKLKLVEGITNADVIMDDRSHHADLLQLDQQATGLDRSETLRTLLDYPYVQMATIVQDNKIVIAALVTQHTNSPLVTVGPILGQEEYVPTLLQGIRESLPPRVTDMVLIVSDHPSLVKTLADVGFEIVFEVGAMTMRGPPLPGERDLYLGLIHPTLG